MARNLGKNRQTNLTNVCRYEGCQDSQLVAERQTISCECLAPLLTEATLEARICRRYLSILDDEQLP